jgi:uncharacterized protein
MLLAVGAVCVRVASAIGGATGFDTALVATPSMLLTGFDVPEVVVINWSATRRQSIRSRCTGCSSTS